MINGLITKASAAGSFQLKLWGSDKAPTSLTDLVNQIIPAVGLVAGILVFIYLVVSGFYFLTANGNADQAKKGQTGIINAVIGLVIILAAYWIFTALTGTVNTISTTSPGL
jgi:hypothetical protein